MLATALHQLLAALAGRGHTAVRIMVPLSFAEAKSPPVSRIYAREAFEAPMPGALLHVVDAGHREAFS